MNDSLNNTDRDSGYTLPELLLTLALTALLILAGSYGWRQHQSARQLASSAHQLMEFIVRQQWHAAWGNRRCRITAVVDERWQLWGDPLCGLGRASPGARREPARCAAPYTGVRLSLSTAGELSLGGLRHTASAAHFVLSNRAGRLRVVVSGRGRVRLCSERGRWAGIPSC